MQNNISKIKMAAEIIEAMKFLNIKVENFRSMRIAAGSLEALHTQMANMLAA